MAGGKHVSFEEWCGGFNYARFNDRARTVYALYCLDIYPYFGYIYVPDYDILTLKLLKAFREIEG